MRNKKITTKLEDEKKKNHKVNVHEMKFKKNVSKTELTMLCKAERDPAKLVSLSDASKGCTMN